MTLNMVSSLILKVSMNLFTEIKADDVELIRKEKAYSNQNKDYMKITNNLFYFIKSIPIK